MIDIALLLKASAKLSRLRACSGRKGKEAVRGVLVVLIPKVERT